MVVTHHLSLMWLWSSATMAFMKRCLMKLCQEDFHCVTWNRQAKHRGAKPGRKWGKGWERDGNPKKKRFKSRLEKCSAMEEDNFPAKLSWYVAYLPWFIRIHILQVVRRIPESPASRDWPLPAPTHENYKRCWTTKAIKSISINDISYIYMRSKLI